MRYGKLLAGIFLGTALLLSSPPGEAARYDDDEIVSVVKGEDDLRQESQAEIPAEAPKAEKKPAKVTADNSRADEWFEEPEGIESEKEPAEKKPVRERYVKIVRDENGFTYYLDTRTAKWRYLPYSTSEKIVDVWVKLVRDGDSDYGSSEDYSYPETYFMEHYYLRPQRQQIQFLCELEVTGRPQNAIKERDYSPANWENLVPGSVEDDIYQAAMEYIKKSRKAPMTRHGQNITVRDALEEFLRISL